MAEDASPARISLSSHSSDHPRPPHITYREVSEQFKADVYGKEVQSAATYYLHVDGRPNGPCMCC